MKQSRRGFQFVEILAALAIIAGPLYTVFGLVHNNAVAARNNADHLFLDLLEDTVMERLVALPAATLDAAAESGSNDLLEKTLTAATASLTTADAAVYQKRIAALVSKKTLAITANAGGHDHLYQLDVTLQTVSGATLRAMRLVHIDAGGPLSLSAAR